MRSVQLHVDELVLHGFDPHLRHAILDAVQDELARLLGQRGLDDVRDLDLVRLDGGAFAFEPEARAAGEAIARSVHAALAGGTKR